MQRVVLDTNVVIAALRSKRGASFAILSRLGENWIPLISPALILEYEAIMACESQRLRLPEGVQEAIISGFCFYGRAVNVHFSVRPALPDPDDEFILELAVAGQATAIITHNVRHFSGARRFGVPAIAPREFLRTIMEEET